jgi:DNA mismatch repair protein MutS2
MNQHSLRVLEFAKIRDALVERATFPGGARRVLRLAPETDPSSISGRLGLVSEIRRILEDSDLPIHGLPDLEDVLGAVEPVGAVLSGPQIAPVARSLRGVRALVAYLHERSETLPLLHARSRDLDGLPELRETIDRHLEPAGEVRDAATPALRRIRRDQERVRGRVLDLLAKIVRSSSAAGSEPVVTLRNDRYVIGIRRDALGDLKGVVHGQSSSGVSVYLEPQAAVGPNNELAELRSAEEEEIRRILTELSDAVRAALPPLGTNESTLADLDAVYAAGRLSRDLDARPAVPSADGSIVIRKGRHPLLEMASRTSGAPVVPLDLELGGERAGTLVITGPNTGGKTVALKTVGLFALMHQAGLHLPAAEGTRFPVFTHVFADIGDEQSIEASLSTFSSHMAQVNGVLRSATEDTLVLLDELGVGTDPEEGAALGKAILTELTRVGARTVVTTHYGSLKVFAHEAEGMENASLEFDRESLAPTYRFRQGVPGSSEGLAIARRLGFPERLVAEARATLGEDQEAIEALLRDLQERRRELDRRGEELERERAETREVRNRAAGRLARLDEERHRLRGEAAEKARRLVERTKAELGALMDAVRREGAAGRAAGRARTRLGELKNDLEREVAAATGDRGPTRPADPAEIEDGTPVFIPKTGWTGTAQGAPGANGKVTVMVGSLRVEVPLDSLEVRPGSAPARNGRGACHRPPSPIARPEREVRTEVDLRGQTVEEAVEEVDRTLDGLVVSGGTWLRIIHGRGTGALRGAITEQLAADDRIKSHRPGEPGEGGDGVTIAELK